MGLPTQFVRFAGCNLRCPGWPCDTPFAIDPKIWRKDSKELTAAELLEQLQPWPMSLTLTGGEPLIQPKDELEFFVSQAISQGYKIDVFTNGLAPHFPDWRSNQITFILDWKLPGSGEEVPQHGHKDERRLRNAQTLSQWDWIKFTIKDGHDLSEAERWYYQLRTERVKTQFTIGRVWNSPMSDQEIVEFFVDRELPWRLNVQQHKLVWGDVRGV